MGIAEVRAAFCEAGEGRIFCRGARLMYDHSSGDERQVLEFDGTYDGREFAIRAPVPPKTDVIVRARQLGCDLVAGLTPKAGDE